MPLFKRQPTLGPHAHPHPVVLWRKHCLREAGFSEQLATVIASDCGYDLDAVLELVDRGCPPDLAARILAPIDERPRTC